MPEPILYQGGGYVVTRSMLRTPRKSYTLRDIQFVSVQRGLLLFAAPPAIAGILFVFRFFRYLYLTESLPLLCVCACALYAAAQVGTLKVRSFALNDGEESNNFGLIRNLVGVRSAVETAIMDRNDGEAA